MNATSDLAMLARVTASLVVVVVLALLAARLARRASVRGPGIGLRVVDRVGLSREAAVAVVEVAGRALVLGITPQKVTVLTELDAQTSAELLAPPPGGRRVAGGSDLGVALAGGSLAGGSLTGGSLAGGSLTGEPAVRSRGTGSVLDPRTWRQGLDALRDATARR